MTTPKGDICHTLMVSPSTSSEARLTSGSLIHGVSAPGKSGTPQALLPRCDAGTQYPLGQGRGEGWE